MARYAYHRKDNNHDEIRDALERVGATVVPDGPVDLVVGFRGATYLIEVKTAKGKLRPTQENFVRRWKGHVAVVRTIDEALKVIGC
jgi:VRR-NUC domain.